MAESCEFGKITEITASHYRITLDENNSCKSCGMNDMCSKKEILVGREEVDSDFELYQPVEMIFEKVVQTSFLLYILPLFFFFAGIMIPQYVFNLEQELLVFGIAMGSLTLSFLGIRLFYKQLDKETYSVKIKSKQTMNSPSFHTGGTYAS